MTEKIGAHLCQHCVGLAAVGHQARRLVERLVDVVLEPRRKVRLKELKQKNEHLSSSSCLVCNCWNSPCTRSARTWLRISTTWSSVVRSTSV